ncbi:WRKY domain [Arabidopsis thaliana x Arabidopsis arenosa]|uniref:WRKY domain n=1 Tax=Arabidopsis thaliana x Arabidopsis arenosa TaxID=1240361 RepID=A0A8T2AFG3_9BRAS|nr:WRKY domain [Arabidopsis thaliana x Arabidopsis arenosa]
MEFTDFSKTSFYYPSSQSVWDLGDLAAAERNSLGFMELLGSQHQDFATVSPHSFLLEPQPQPSAKLSSTIIQAPPSEQLVTSKVEPLCSDHLLINPPATPNSSSISSASSEALNEEKPKRDNEEEEEEEKSHTKKQLKPKKNNQKRQREARVAFMTKSEVDHLEDGYRWRKYGQKAVKNSPFPRSYYRCTTASCNVKKRVERSFRDPSTVVTTYEGQHTHISPLTSRPISTGGFFGSSGAASNLGNGCFGFPIDGSTLISPQFQQLVHYHHQQQQQELMSCFGGVGEYLNSHASEYDDDNRVKKSRVLVKDNGLLQDVVPSHMLKEE